MGICGAVEARSGSQGCTLTPDTCQMLGGWGGLAVTVSLLLAVFGRWPSLCLFSLISSGFKEPPIQTVGTVVAGFGLDLHTLSSSAQLKRASVLSQRTRRLNQTINKMSQC